MHLIQLTTPSGDTEISVGELLSSGLHGLEPEPVLLVDEQVQSFYSELFSPFRCITIPSGEQHKTLQTVEGICRELVQMEVDRSSLLVGVGGGLATDIAGFVASTYLREVRFGFISSTLLGQVDASIGGKNGVNLDGYKNMIGTIRQPSFVWCDLSLLNTLPHKEYVAGIAEVIKYGVIRDRDFLHYLKDHMSALLTLDGDVLEKVVTTSVSVKVNIVQQDEKESDLRKLLNFGHTIGHAIERDKKVLHGEAVATGMVLAARLSNTLGLLSASGVEMIEELVGLAGLPVRMDMDPDVLYQNIRKDKKKSGDLVHFVLLEELGHAMIRPIPLTELNHMLHDLC
ncbi:MAG: 3-dehydroquinate synthase [Bacteroidales bacterium]|nr:3-dehydroquinate synthase [Bacteroidales bacterium]